MISEAEKPLAEYSQEGLQSYANSIYSRHRECKDKVVKDILKSKFREIIMLYNMRSSLGAKFNIEHDN